LEGGYVSQMVTLTKGTKEFLPIKILDALENVQTLDGLGLTHDLYKADEAETLVYANQSTLNDGMIALPLIDTNLTDGGAPPIDLIPEGEYNCFLKFTSLPEVPRLGPFTFRVDD